MKKSGILNADLARIVALMGHTDRLIACDAGLPIPQGNVVVDLALTSYIPRFFDTVDVILKELQVERAVLAAEMETGNETLFGAIRDLLAGVEAQVVPHDRFEEVMNGEGNLFFVRTGEATPYANVILYSGVIF